MRTIRLFIGQLLVVICGMIMTACEKEDMENQYDTLHVSAGQKVSILGDSYSTFEGYVYPDTNVCYYPCHDVNTVELMWWHLFISKYGLVLEKNNSYSGSTICYRESAPGNSYIERAGNLGNPDIILVFGGTNDSWQNLPFGNYQYTDFEDKELYKFRPAFAFLMGYLKQLYPQATIVNLINPGINIGYQVAMTDITKYYGICNIELGSFYLTTTGHPTSEGMASIAAQLSARVR